MMDSAAMPVFEQECSFDPENALLICNIKPVLFNFRDLASAVATSYACLIPIQYHVCVWT